MKRLSAGKGNAKHSFTQKGKEREMVGNRWREKEKDRMEEDQREKMADDGERREADKSL